MGSDNKVQKTCPNCSQLYYKCGNALCRRSGCQTVDCDKQQFQQHDECLSCGRNHMNPMMVSEKQRDKEKRAAVTRSVSSPPAIRIETIFLGGAALLLAAVMIGSFLTGAGKRGDRTVVAVEDAPVVSVNDTGFQTGSFRLTSSNSICACYDDAFKAAASKETVLSSYYKTGFLICRRIAGWDGGEAWTAGWTARKEARPFETSCRSYRRRASRG